MTQKETNRPASRQEKAAASAPELPTEVAQQYGLHHDTPAEVEDAAQTLPQENPLVESAKTDAAVDDILSKESDELLAVQDAAKQDMPPLKRGFWHRIGAFFVAWWHNKWARWGTVVVLLAAIGTMAAIPKARYAVLNTVGVRSSASVVVLDSATQLPLKNVAVALDGAKTQTDIDGIAKLRNLKLGDYTLTIKRIAFAPYTRHVTIGWGSNPLGEFELEATGTQYVMVVTDYVSGKPIEGAEAESEEANALSDKDGKITLTVEDTDITELPVTVRAAGFRSEELTLNAEATAPSPVVLVPSQKEVFVSKQSGTYDVYSIDVDGKNQKLLLKGTGNEGSNLELVVDPNSEKAAFVSTRDNVRNNDGYLLYTLTIIDIQTGASTAADHAEQIQLTDWIGDRLIYRSTIAGASAADPTRNRLVAYNYDTNAKMQLATANQLNAVVSAQGAIYYAPSSTDPKATLGLFRVKPDGSARERLFEKEVWTGLRTTYNTLSLQTPEGWYAFSLDTRQVSKGSAPAAFTNYLFVQNSKGQQAAWVDTRDGKGVLLLQQLSSGVNTTLATQSGLTYPVRWAGERAIIYRVVTGTESADYVVGPSGGKARKIVDVTPTYGYTQAY